MMFIENIFGFIFIYLFFYINFLLCVFVVLMYFY